MASQATTPLDRATKILPRHLAGFRDYHSGETLIVCGCGASLNELKNPETFITIGVNDVGRLFDPTYLVVLNGRTQFSGDRFRYVEQSRARTLFTQLDLGIRHPHIVRFRLGRYGGTDFSNPEVLHYTRNSPYLALYLAVHMGAKRIGLIGVDFTDDHFFAHTGRHPLERNLAQIDREYGALVRACHARGIEVFNLGVRSRLTTLPKVPPEAFLSGSAPVQVSNSALVAPENAHRLRLFFVHYRFLSCGEVFTDGLHHAAIELSLEHAGAYWDDPDLLGKIRGFGPDLLFVVHGRRFAQRWGGRFRDLNAAVWLLDEPYEVDDTARWSGQFQTVFVNDPATLDRHRNAHYLPVAFDPAVHAPGAEPRCYKVGFIGGYNARREHMLCSLADSELLSYVVGGPWRSPVLKRLCLAENLPAVQATELYRRTRIVINVFRERHHFNRHGVPASSLNPRIYEALACGALVVSERRAEATQVFPEMPLFDNERALVELVRDLLADQSRCDRLLRACRERLTGHSYAQRLQAAIMASLGGRHAVLIPSVPTTTPRRPAPGPEELPMHARVEFTNQPLPFTAMPVRNLLYHLWPVKGAMWQWNLEQLIRRIDLFNGRRLVAIVHDDRSEAPEAIVEKLEGHGCEFMVEANGPTGEGVTFPRLLREIASSDPNEIAFYAHGKGVKYEPNVPSPVRRWAEVQYRTSLDDWLRVWRHLQRFVMTGPIKRMGRYRTHQELGDWHYCGTFFWLRHASIFSRNCLDPPDFYGGVEAWPGIHFRNHETGCLFVNAQRQAPYTDTFWRSIGNVALRSWESGIESIPVPTDLAQPVGLDGCEWPRTEQKPEELAWWISLLLEREIRNLLVIGSGHGGVEWHVARAFREQGRDIALTCIERRPSPELEQTMDDIRQRFRQTVRLVEADSGHADIPRLLDERYEAVFIDGDHGYRAVRSDWLLAKRLHPRLVGFHDIVDSHWHAQNRCCVSRLWREIKAEHETVEQGAGEWGGIGVVMDLQEGDHVSGL